MKTTKRKKIQPWAAVIVAAGQSKRLKSHIPKPFLYIDHRRTMLDMCLESFGKVPGLAYVIIVTTQDYMEQALQAIYRWKLPGIVTKGGEEREDSVRNGLEVVPPGVRHVLIHDAARPLVGPAVIERVLEMASRSGAAIPVIPVKDTLKILSNGRVVKTLDRSKIGAVQTPQGFKLTTLKKAFKKLGRKASRLTDDAAVVEAAGMKVKVVQGDLLNFKVTTPDDLRHVKDLVWWEKSREFRLD
ncbi:MAG TPA: 2-C-methyl-D-erythritol 4-phosphate cytidylyltransferase [bacterium]|nr:2-C-methyl-D-erythritol 4-phosphate cytidylyltransferase [bacterium]